MCLIAVKAIGVDLPKDIYLREADKINSDGIGVAWWKSGSSEIKIKKNFLNIEELLRWMHETIKVEDSMMIHFRWATSGLKDKGNRHPFPITKNYQLLRSEELICQQAVAHNGVMSDYAKSKTYSDTQKFIVDILADDAIKNNLQNPTVRKLIENFIGNDRLSIMDNSGHMYLIGDWEKDEDIFYSNYSYKPRTNWLQNYWHRDSGSGWRGWHRDFETTTPTNSSIGKSISKTLKNPDGIYEICEGCHQKKWVIEMEVKEITFLLCKKCRKGVRKGRLTIDKDDDKDNTLGQCDGCKTWIDKKTMISVDGAKLCESCIECLKQIKDIDDEIKKVKKLEDKTSEVAEDAAAVEEIMKEQNLN
jgi:hypothetical protein